jgi:hypothetical protein
MKGISNMSRMKSVFAIAVMIAVAGAVQAANAQATLKVLMVGASGSWQAFGVGAYKTGHCPTGSRAGCGHVTFGKTTAVNLVDSRTGGTGTSEVGAQIWIVWDNTTNDPSCATSCNVWAYVKIDSIVGNRCFFATPRCNVTIPAFPAPGAAGEGLISVNAAWPAGTEASPPATVQAIFTAGHLVNIAVSEIRPEDASLGQCRINSQVGPAGDGLNGLGYGLNATGVCPTFASPAANKAGTQLTSAYPGSANTANPIAFNIAGKDPFTNSTIPAFTTVNVGASPLIFVTDRQNASGLQGVSNVTLSQLQTVFSGTNCQAASLGGGAGDLNVFVREPLSGTMNAAEYTAFRLPRNAAGNYAGVSQETGLTGLQPVSNVACGGGGARYRAIGTGDEISFIHDSNNPAKVAVAQDGIGYYFFSYGNNSKLAHSANYGYLQINNVDPIWELYGSSYDPGEALVQAAVGSGALPNATTDLPAACAGAFPCSETNIWKGKMSFPNVRNGSYRQWIMVRVIGSTGSAPLTAAQALVTSAQLGVVASVPDFIPAVATVSGTFTDPGLKLLHSHYTQNSPGYTKTPVNQGATEAGGDEGGCIEPIGSTAVGLVYRDPAPCAVGP